MLTILFRLSLLVFVVGLLVTAVTGKYLGVPAAAIFAAIALFFLRMIW